MRKLYTCLMHHPGVLCLEAGVVLPVVLRSLLDKVQGSSEWLPDITLKLLSTPAAARQYHMAPRPGFGGFFFLNTNTIIRYTKSDWLNSVEFVEFQSYIRKISWGTLYLSCRLIGAIPGACRSVWRLLIQDSDNEEGNQVIFFFFFIVKGKCKENCGIKGDGKSSFLVDNRFLFIITYNNNNCKQ